MALMRAVPSRFAVVGAALSTIPGCAPASPGAFVTTRDSAGVAIVESASPSWTPETQWSVGTTPALDLARTGSGPMHEFFRVADATFGLDGGIVVADRGSAQVRFFDASGRFMAALGAEGDGPGEFRRLANVERYQGDSVVAFDPRAGRGTIIGASGALGRVVTFEIPRNTVHSEIDPLRVTTPDGFFVVATVMPSGMPTPGLARFPQFVFDISATGALRDTVATMRGFEQYLGPRAIETPPLARFSYATSHGDQLYVCEGERPEYTIYGRDGTLRRLVRWAGLALDVPGHVLDSIRTSVAARRDREGMADGLSATYPSCSGILVDALGYVWLERYHPPFVPSSGPRSWLVFAPGGAWLGQLDLPANFEVFDVDETRILGVARNSLDVETLQVLRLKRDGGG